MGEIRSCNCFPDDGTELRAFPWWTARFNYRQDYPGKVFLALRRHEEDVLALAAEEREEVWEAAGVVRAAIDRVLQPDWWNYMFLGNAVRHVHLHMIPRYAGPRTIQGWEFRDRHWGSLHARQPEPPEEVFRWLLARVKQALAV
ncbi:MAG: HIT domain-containing protein [Armatimonadetes bacterium]|nr:HIT domain-containing protein [Armatimonadota bacterium]